MSDQHHEQGWNVQVRIVRAALSTVSASPLHSSEIVCEITNLRTNETASSAKLNNTTYPHWHESLFFHGVRPMDIFSVQVWHEHNRIRDHIVRLWEPAVQTERLLQGHATISVGAAVERASDVLVMAAKEISSMETATNVPASGPSALYGPISENVVPQRYDDCQGEKPHHHLFSTQDMASASRLNKYIEQMAFDYSLDPYGSIRIAVADRTVPPLSTLLPGNKYKMCINFKYTVGETKLAWNWICRQIREYFPDLETSGTKSFMRKIGARFRARLTEEFPTWQAYLDSVSNVYPTWKINMHHVTDIFGSIRQPWNREYPSAQKIFQTPGVLAAVEAQHGVLYGGSLGLHSVIGMENIRQKWTCETGTVLGGYEFLKLINWGERDGRSRLFTYVLMPDRLYLSETGGTWTYDMISKHAMHANGAEEVVYAGELLVRQDMINGSQTYVLVLDNNSGTYAPSELHLHLLREVIIRNFFGLDVEVYSFQHSRMVQLRSDCI